MDTINSTYLWDQSCKKLDWIRFGPDEEPPEQMNVVACSESGANRQG